MTAARARAGRPVRRRPRRPGRELAALDDDDAAVVPLTPAEREDVLADLEDLEVFEALLEPRGVRGLVVDCRLRRAALLRLGPAAGQPALPARRRTPRVHEPAYSPDPADYVTWDYARGFTDAALDG